MEDLTQHFSEKIIQKGHEYYREGRVKHAVKDGNMLRGVVEGNFDYRVKVDLEAGEVNCSCPYEDNCKHAVALILAYKNGECINSDEIKNSLKEMEKEELIEFIFSNAIKDSKILKEILRRVGARRREKSAVSGVESELYKGIFKDIDTDYFPRKFLDAASSVAASNKATILDFLERYMENEDEIVEAFPEGYYGQDFPGDEDLYSAMQELIEAFVTQKPSEEEWRKFLKISKKSGYAYLENDSIFLEHHGHIPEKYAKKLMDNSYFVRYLIKKGKLEEAINVCRDKVQKFNILKQRDAEEALNFGLEYLIPDNANAVAGFMLDCGKDKKDMLATLLKDKNPSYELLLKVEDAVQEKKHIVYDALFKKKAYNTYYLLCVRFNDDDGLRRLARVDLDDELCLLVGKRLIGEYQEGIKILEKSLLRIVKEAYDGYIEYAIERFKVIAEHNLAYAKELYGKIAEKYSTRSKLKHEFKKALYESC